MELIHRQVSRYAAFTVADEAEAVSALSRAAPMMYKSPPKFTGFNEDGFLTGLEPPDTDGDSQSTDDWGAFIDETIHLATFDAGVCLLTLELFDELMDPNEPLHSDNIVLAKMLERIAEA
ncbi:MAG: hypothetical protein IH865_02405 [Chloroflexi bacterium]|nr:hypothetical protein [Chloroflexota bacterium]